MKLLGIDPGLRNTGWGVIETDGNRIIYLGDGAVTSDPSLSLAERLVQLHDGLLSVIERFQPKEAAVDRSNGRHLCQASSRADQQATKFHLLQDGLGSS